MCGVAAALPFQLLRGSLQHGTWQQSGCCPDDAELQGEQGDLYTQPGVIDLLSKPKPLLLSLTLANMKLALPVIGLIDLC